MLTGLLAVAAVPAGVGLAELLRQVKLLDAAAAIPVGLAFGLLALWLSRGARRRFERTLGRVGGGRAARAGRVLGIAGISLAVAAAIALATYHALVRWAE